MELAMNVPDGIPSWAWEMADQITLGYIRDDRTSNVLKMMLMRMEILREHVARALMTERDECAGVAERDGSSHERTGTYNHDQTVQVQTADRIANTFRARSNP
jgi:hypothetical protein